MIKIVLSDVDGTLIPFGRGYASARTLAAIDELRAAGIEFGLATGRNVYELTKFFDGSTSAFRTGILANGMRVRVGGEDRMYSMLSREGLLQLTDYLAGVPGVFLFVYANDDSGAVRPKVLACTPDELEKFNTTVFPTNGDWAEEMPDYDIVSACIASLAGQDVLDEVKARAAELVRCFDYLQPISCWCDVLPKGMNKGSSVGRFAREMGVSPDEILFFGDAENDLPIFGTLENTCAMANATPAAAAAARWHVGACEDDGVAEALEELARAARAGETPAFMR